MMQSAKGKYQNAENNFQRGGGKNKIAEGKKQKVKAKDKNKSKN
jgi:hypothetical protein